MNVQPYHCFNTVVARVVRLSPHFVRVTFTGDELAHFCVDGPDQRIKLMLPLPDGSVTDVGQLDETTPVREWYTRWRMLPDTDRNPLRTYTVRAWRPELREIDVDFVLHGIHGPASAWASSAVPGQQMVVIGPDARAKDRGGFEWKPGAATNVLIGGDETAGPAICAIVESLPQAVRGDVFIEVPTAADAMPLTTSAGINISWLARNDASHGERLGAAIREWGSRRLSTGCGDHLASPGQAYPFEESDASETLWEVPEQSSSADYAWLAGESRTITALRRYLVRDLNIDRGSVAFMGYWRLGRAES
ncbi:siderophore-interacting protein [Gulosibacter hominis]|uniref:siderophore-interacting protein n=1 Tax=Gulosibacter hominis TaxID=2770504 RepID=UPI001917B1FB|nr:siderophore-interacting protein [Gulosibacter hominis]